MRDQELVFRDVDRLPGHARQAIRIAVIGVLASCAPISSKDALATRVNYNRGSDGPVAVVNTRSVHVKGSETPGFVITLANESTKPIGFVEFVLSPAECPRSGKPLAYLVGYGGENETSRPIAAGEQEDVTIPGGTFGRVQQYQDRAGCTPEELPELLLTRVGFCDGTGWYGRATGPDHSEWSGRPWVWTGGGCTPRQ